MSFRTKHGALSRIKALLHWPRFNHVAAAGKSEARGASGMSSGSAEHMGKFDVSKWKRYDSRQFGINSSMIPRYALHVLSSLRNEGFEAYLVGGCVRDLLLKRIPKDFDVITTANLRKVKKQFRTGHIVGRRFPICMIRFRSSVVEVSSFGTAAENAAVAQKQPPIPRGCSEMDFIRWKDSIKRDFTVNSLFLDPYMHVIYDYTNGMADLDSFMLRTLIPAKSSFTEDCARILRGLRIAARLDLTFSEETEEAIYSLSSTIKCLPQNRIIMEINYMLAYGAAAPSLRLLWKFRLLDILLPFQAAYLDKLDGDPSSHSSSMLMKLLFNMDKFVSCDRPSESALWVGLLAFHLALVRCPQDARVVWAFASILHLGCRMGVKLALTEATEVHFVPEISGFSQYDVAELEEKVGDLACLVKKSVIALSDSKSLSEAMSKYPHSSCSGLMVVSKKAAREAQGIFHVPVEHSIEEVHDSRFNNESHKSSLGMTRSLLGKIILGTLRDGAGEETRDAERQELGKNTAGKCWEEVRLADTPAAEEHLRLRNPTGSGTMESAMRRKVHQEPRGTSEKRTIVELWQRRETDERIQASGRKQSAGAGKESKSRPAAKMESSMRHKVHQDPKDTSRKRTVLDLWQGHETAERNQASGSKQSVGTRNKSDSRPASKMQKTVAGKADKPEYAP